MTDKKKYLKKKYLYIVTTQQTINQTWDYEFESDEEMTQRQDMEYVLKNGIERECMDEDLVTDEVLWDFHKHEVKWEEKA